MTAPKNPRPIGLPTTISTTQVVENLKKAALIDAKRNQRPGKLVMEKLKPADGLPFGQPKAEARLPTKAERDAELMRASYRVTDTTPSKVDLSVTDVAGTMSLEVTAIDGYDHNPRLYTNEKFDDIEASIRANGFHDALVVTRRRPGERYMLAAGSNTTLAILKKLWETTGEERYRWVNCVFQPYEGETKLLAQHLGENLNRGDMKFWEVAKGMVDLMNQVQESAGRQLSVRDLAEEIGKLGLRSDKATIGRWQFAVARLNALGNATSKLNFRAVSDTIQPRLSAIRTLASKHKVTEEDFWSKIVEPTLRAYAQEFDQSTAEDFDATVLCDQVESNFAEHVDDSLASVRQMLSLLKLSPELTLADLRMPSPNLAASNAPRGQAEQSGLDSDAPSGSGPVSTTTQAPLALGPSVVRGAGANPPSPPPQRSTLTQPPGPTTAQQQREAPDSLFTQHQDATDPLGMLHGAVRELLDSTNLTDTLRLSDEMPLGFYLELPDRAIHARKKVDLHSPEFDVRTVKTVVWWSLVQMTGQYREGVVPFIDHASAYYKSFAAPSDSINPLDGTDIDDQGPDGEAMILHRLSPGAMRHAMQHLRAVEEAAAHMFEQRPERWRRMQEIVYASK